MLPYGLRIWNTRTRTSGFYPSVNRFFIWRIVLKQAILYVRFERVESVWQFSRDSYGDRIRLFVGPS